MRLLIAAALIASPAFAEEKTLLEKDCMEVMGPTAYGPETYGSGVIAGIVIGYVIAQGGKFEDANKIGRMAGGLCRQKPGYTFGDVLRTFDQD